jgi:hypothetical protein
MDRDDVIRMAREAGVPHTYWGDLCPEYDIDVLERFAALVAAAEREACAELCPRFYDTEEVERAIRARGEK